jgi:hypothetical protein
MDKYHFLISSRPVQGQEAEYNRWYDEEHIADVLAIPGFTGARRLVTEKADGREYLTIWEIESDDPKSVIAQIGVRAKSGEMRMSPAIDMKSAQSTLYKVWDGAA